MIAFTECPRRRDRKDRQEEEREPLAVPLADNIGFIVAARAVSVDRLGRGVARHDRSGAEKDDESAARLSPVFAFHTQTVPDQATRL
jgi:hypothetical protein